ncbi:MAG: DegV family protein [Anaerolineaceae bacterium]|jgi:DegV family protein with EDD domain
MANKVAIVTDSTGALPENINKECKLHIVPLLIEWDGKTYVDGVDLKPQAFYEKLSASKTIPTTSQPSTAAFSDTFAPLIEQGYDILCLPISSKISGTYLSASTAAKQFPENRIEVLDTLYTSLALGIITILAARAAQQGASLLECHNIAMDAASRMHVYFAVETLEYLQKGGRINSATKFLGTALDIKPILELKDGLIVPCEQVRTSKKAHLRLLELAENIVGPMGTIEYLGLVSANNPEALDELHTKAHQRFRVKEEVFAGTSPVLGTHVGPGMVGIVILA